MGKRKLSSILILNHDLRINIPHRITYFKILIFTSDYILCFLNTAILYYQLVDEPYLLFFWINATFNLLNSKGYKQSGVVDGRFTRKRPPRYLRYFTLQQSL